MKNNILMSENIRQKRLKILEYFDACICHHYNTCISILSFPSSTNLVKDVEIIYRKTLISTAKNNIEIAQSQLLELTSPHD